MAEIQLSKRVFENLLEQLNTIEEKKESLSHSPGISDNRNEFAKLIDSYECRLRELVESVNQIETDDTSVPFVVIGSKVEVFCLESKETITYRIVNPAVFKLEGNDVTYLSPIGKALLLKEVGDLVDIKVPAGAIRYEIKSINLQSEIEHSSI